MSEEASTTETVDPRGWTPDAAAMAVSVAWQVIEMARRGEADDPLLRMAAGLLLAINEYLRHLDALPDPTLPGERPWGSSDEFEFEPVHATTPISRPGP